MRSSLSTRIAAALALALAAGGLAACGERTPAAGEAEAPAAVAADADLGDGFVVWESNRDGSWGLWIRDLDGSPPRRLSPAEPGRPHCCPHVAPDGRAVVYLSLEPGQDPYPERGALGELRWLPVGGGEPRRLAERARTYYENRAAVWRDEEELIYVDGDGFPARLDLDSGRSERLTESPPADQPYLLDSTLSWAATGLEGFFRYDRERRAILPRTPLGGCQFYFSNDGRFGLWSAGAGGPIARLEFDSGEIATLLRKYDERIPDGFGYMYFPMPSHDSTLLAFAASRGEHDHFAADYEVFLVETDPATLAPLGPVHRWTRDPATDRFPAVWRAPESAPPRDSIAAPAALELTRRAAPEAFGWPSRRDGLLFVWATGDAPNLVPDPEIEAERATILARRGRARLDRHFAAVVDRGWLEASAEDAERVWRGLQRTNELSLELTVEPAPDRQPGRGILASQGRAGGQKNFLLVDGAGGGFFKMRAGGWRVERSPQQAFAALPAGRKSHWVVTYTPGRLAAYRDGEPVVASQSVQGDFFQWQSLPLTFGAEPGGGLDWAGTLEGLAIYDRVLAPDEVRENHRRYRELLAERSHGARAGGTARLEACSPALSLDEIAPYREALVVCRYRVESGLEGFAVDGGLRVAQWSLLDGREVTLPAPGAAVRLLVEPYDAQPQLEAVPVSDTVGGPGPLAYRVD